jgi:Fe-Mn family superoxide dismutase
MFSLDTLPFPYNALEPYIDEETMRIHHTKHHQTYVDKLNEIVVANPDLAEKGLEELLADSRTKNMAGGVWNHNLFWKFLTPGYKVEVNNRDEFMAASLKLFGSGWVWLTNDQKIITTVNQDAPPKNVILGIDLWEHAYYLKYQNRRKDYIEAFLKIILSQ